MQHDTSGAQVMPSIQGANLSSMKIVINFIPIVSRKFQSQHTDLYEPHYLIYT